MFLHISILFNSFNLFKQRPTKFILIALSFRVIVSLIVNVSCHVACNFYNNINVHDGLRK